MALNHYEPPVQTESSVTAELSEFIPIMTLTADCEDNLSHTTTAHVTETERPQPVKYFLLFNQAPNWSTGLVNQHMLLDFLIQNTDLLYISQILHSAFCLRMN